MAEKNKEILEEVMNEIDSALKDAKGIILHQRRLAFALSLGSVALLENYLDKEKVLKGGGKINHLWLKKNKSNVKKFISNQITCPVEKIPKLDKLLDLIFEIENKRNNVAYGPPAPEKELNKLIDSFFRLRKEVEND